jgi:hypothetical protein
MRFDNPSLEEKPMKGFSPYWIGAAALQTPHYAQLHPSFATTAF